MLDNRCSRVLDPDHRAMLPPGEWAWFLDQAHGDYDHLVVGSSLPWLLPHGIHHLEAWNERLAGSPAASVAASAERLRRAVDLEHWAAFQRSFEELAELFARLGSGPRTAGGERVGAGPAYPAPASISVLSGDVHHSYVARARFRRPRGGHAGAPAHLLADPQPGAGGDAPVMTLGWWRGPSALVRGAGQDRPGTQAGGPLAQAGRPVLRQRGQHAVAVGGLGRGDHRGHSGGRRPHQGRVAAADRAGGGTASGAGPGDETGRRVHERTGMMPR